MNSGLHSTTVIVHLEIQRVSCWVRGASVPLTATVSCGSGTLTPVLLGGQPVARGYCGAVPPHPFLVICHHLSSRVRMVPKTRLWGAQAGIDRSPEEAEGLQGCYQGGSEDELWRSLRV